MHPLFVMHCFTRFNLLIHIFTCRVFVHYSFVPPITHPHSLILSRIPSSSSSPVFSHPLPRPPTPPSFSLVVPTW